MDHRFRNRTEAGRILARRIPERYHAPDTLVLALPRGGVPVGLEVARHLNLPLDVLLVRKLGTPGQRELAMGAVASGGFRFLDQETIRFLGIPPDAIEAVTAREEAELARRETAYRQGAPAPDPRGRTVILVDDGFATGSSMKVAVLAMRAAGAARIVIAVPLGASETCAELNRLVDEVICLETPEPFEAVGLWYQDFDQVTDDQVKEMLALGRTPARATPPERP